jgi:hypothetical protein
VETYELNCSSKVAVLETYCKKGLHGQRCQQRTEQFREEQGTYKNPTSVLSVEMDAELKAEHCVEPEREMQFCAMACGAAARTDRSAVLVLRPIELCFRLVVEQFPLAPLDELELELELEAIVGWRGDCEDAVISKGLALYGDDRWMVWWWPFSVFSSLMFRFAVLPQSSRRASSSFALLIFSTSSLDWAQTIIRQAATNQKLPESR